MNASHAGLLISPESHEELRLVVFSSHEEVSGSGLVFEDIDEGLLVSEKGFHYPVTGGIPRMLPNPRQLFASFYSKWRSKIAEIKGLEQPAKTGPADSFLTEYLPTLLRFGREWKKHNIQGLTWGLDEETRIHHYFQYMDARKEDLAGKFVLDAGAGTGQLSCNLSRFGCTMVGIDLSHSIEVGWQLRKTFAPDHYQNILFVQGNLMHPPFRSHTFDFVHSSGVLHHTPDTHAAFTEVAKLVKEGGKYAIWLYSKNKGSDLPLIPFIGLKALSVNTKKLRTFSPKIPPAFLYQLIYLYCGLHQLAYKLNALVRGRKHEQRLRERVTSLFDNLAPPFVWQHEPEEVAGWFQKDGFVYIKDTSIPGDPDGFNICGTKRL